MVKAFLSVCLFFSVIAIGKNADPKKCPDIRGNWLCSVMINGEVESSVTMYYKSTQAVKAKGEIHYNIGGHTIVARPDVETVADGFTTICQDGKLVMNIVTDGVRSVETITRESPTKMKAEILSIDPDPRGNDSTVYLCDLTN